ncbi:MAG TPA: hypothetical protein VNK46_08275 [Nitrospiraceae bacterium]|jgi:hypothetical protein|nr:hypothetical protein [Nitrospiraceae bacterium]
MLSGLVGFFALLASDDDGFIFLDHVNLVFHEAGHPLFGLFGETVGLYGGTLGQLAIPFLVWLVFWRRRDTLGCAVAGVWFFENVLNIARYMADARSQILPLVGGGEHDWERIFSRWSVLASDTVIARRVSILGWAGMLLTCAWLVLRWYRTEARERTVS